MSDGTSAPGVPVHPRRAASGLYYGWILVGALGFTAMVSYGILSYSFAVFLAPMEAETGWTRTSLTGAFSVAALVAGLAARPVGRWVDRHGARWVMTAGSALAAVLLLAWSRVDTLWGFYAIWIGLGIASAAVLYEPAFAVVASWFSRRRGMALTLLTFLGGLASVVFVPLTAALVERHGWREALAWLAAILLVATVPPHALLLRRRPADLGLLPDGAPPKGEKPFGPGARARGVPRGPAAPPAVEARAAVRSGSFRWLTVAFGLSAVVTTAITVHLVPLLLDRGYEVAEAAAVMALVGLMALPGRLVFTPLGSVLPRPAVTASIFLLQAAAVTLLMTSAAPAAVWGFAALFGAGSGAITPARAALVADLYGSVEYGSISGTMALLLSFARAAAPVGASLLYGAAGGYAGVLAGLLGASLVSAVAVARAGRVPRAPRVARDPVPGGAR